MKFKTKNSKTVDTPVETCMKLSKNGQDTKVDPTYFKSLVGSFRNLTVTKPGNFMVLDLLVGTWSRLHKFIYCAISRKH